MIAGLIGKKSCKKQKNNTQKKKLLIKRVLLTKQRGYKRKVKRAL